MSNLRTALHTLALSLVTLLCLTPARAQTESAAGGSGIGPYTSIVVFGDSLSDIGNAADVSSAKYLVRYPGPLFNYADGAFTDSADTRPPAVAHFGIYVQQLAPIVSPAGAPLSPLKASLDGGTDYAYGDALTSDGMRTVMSSGLSVQINNMGQQVTDYLATRPTPSGSTLFILYGGGNDLFADSSSTSVSTAVANLGGLIQRLAAAGATQFLIPNLPPLGDVPEYLGGARSALLDTAAASFNLQLSSQLTALQTSLGQTVHFYPVDVFTLFKAVEANPAAFNLTNTNSPAQGSSGPADQYLFWDKIHPTTTGHFLLANAAETALSSATAAATTTTLKVDFITGNNQTFTATVLPSVAGSTPAPTGTVSFLDGTTVLGTGTLVNGTATFTPAIGLAVGTHRLSAQYSGDTKYAASTSPTSVLVFDPGPLTTTTLSTSAATSAFGASITLTTLTTATSPNPPPSNVTFYDGANVIGSAVSNTAGVATLSISTLAVGVHTLTAMYAGVAPYLYSTSPAITVTVAPAVNFTASASPASLTVTSGQSGTSTITLTPSTGFAGTVTFSCGTLPAHASCSFVPSSLTFTAGSSTPQTTDLFIGTTTIAASQRPVFPGTRRAEIYSALALFPAFGFFALAAFRKRRFRTLHLISNAAFLGVVAFGISGCAHNSPAAPHPNFTPAGTYPITVNLTANGATIPLVLQLTVK